MDMKPRNQYKKSFPKRETFLDVGTPVYFHLFKRKTPDIHFLCSGTIVRTPTSTSPVYKVVPTAICIRTLTHGQLRKEAENFLGGTYPCPVKEVTTTSTEWMKKMYPIEDWINIKEKIK